MATPSVRTDAQVEVIQATQAAGESAAGAGAGKYPYSLPYESYPKKVTRQEEILLEQTQASAALMPFKSAGGDMELGITAGKWYNGDTLVSFAEADVTLTQANGDNYVYITPTGTATVATAWPVPSVTPHIPIAIVTCAAGAYTFDDIDRTVRTSVFVGVAGSEVIEECTVYNDTGVQIDAGKVLSVSGWDATNSCFEVVLADADSTALPGQLMATENIANTATGIAANRYDLTGQNTNAGNVGDPVYLSATAGGWVLAAPTGADQVKQEVGVVTVKDPAAGIIRFHVGLGGTQEMVGTSRLQALAVTTAKIAADAVDKTKINTDVAGKGINQAAGGELDLDINSCDAAAVDLTADSVAILDATDSASKKEAVTDIISAMAGDGLQQNGATKVLDVDVSQFAGKGVIDDGSENLDLDINSCDAAVADLTADSFAILDATDSASKKEAIADFLGAIAGAGIVSNAGTKVLDIDAGGVTDAMLASSLAKRTAILAFGYVDFAGRPADADLLTLNGRKYEYDSDASFPDAGGDVIIDANAAANVDDDITACAVAINGDGSATMSAVADTTNDILWLYALTAGAAGNALTLVSALANTTASGANLTDGADAAVAVVWPLRHTITAQEATEGILRFDTGLSSIESLHVMIEDNDAASVMTYLTALANVAGGIITITEGGAWGANDVLNIIAVGTA